MTNREVYERILKLKETLQGKSLPSLEEYLRSLWFLASQSSNAELTIEQICSWLELSFDEKPAPFRPEWMNLKLDFQKMLSDYDKWENLILFQIADLRRMARAGLLDNKYRYFGLDSPSGTRWYNFDPLTYLECGVRGTLGGYKEDEVIVLIAPSEGETADDPTHEIKIFTWKDFTNILKCGQWYE
jgi:hypothetical protein